MRLRSKIRVAWGNAYPEVWRSGKEIKNVLQILGTGRESVMALCVLESTRLFVYFMR